MFEAGAAMTCPDQLFPVDLILGRREAELQLCRLQCCFLTPLIGNWLVFKRHLEPSFAPPPIVHSAMAHHTSSGCANTICHARFVSINP